jgi:L-ascorbate metabolism protein UlaG (beta-lactamase superfamily)
MARSIPVLAALLFCAAAAPAEDKKLLIRWHGQSFFQIVTPAGTRIVLDPHAIEAYGRKLVPADLVLLSHFHSDHVQLDSVENASKAKVLNALKRGEREFEYNVVDEQFKDVHLKTLGTYHDAMSGLQRGKNGVWIIDVAGLRLVHLGDLGHTLSKEQVDKLTDRGRKKVDVLMVPIGGVYTLNGIDAQKVVEQIKPERYIVPMHYGTLVYTDLLDTKYFLEDQTMGTVQKIAGNELAVDPKADPPKEPIIPLLHWEGKVGKKE